MPHQREVIIEFTSGTHARFEGDPDKVQITFEEGFAIMSVADSFLSREGTFTAWPAHLVKSVVSKVVWQDEPAVEGA